GGFFLMTACQLNRLDGLAQRYPKDRLLVLPLNVTQPNQIAAAFAEAKRAFGRINVVFNNAGFGHIRELEATEEVTARALFEMNFWGAMSITREAVKCFHETNSPGDGGQLLQMLSYGGLIGIPGASFYGVSKFALEGASESLAAELDPAWNIKVTIVEPGWIRTELASRAAWSPEHPAYQNPNLPLTHVRRFGWDEATMAWKDARRSAEAVYNIACMPDPPLHFVVGKDAIKAVRKKIAALAADIDAHEGLSEGLEE
ncbi:hypothetical protein V8D89_005088, partial [Ganoderma adspersum]